MIALLGDAMNGAVLAGLAGERQLIVRLIGSGSLVGYRWVRVRGCRRCEVGIVAGEVRGEWRRLVELTHYRSQR
jgi:hypothetical protein